jgi:LysR family hydrogen peroxide-inducible transcriptional activator
MQIRDLERELGVALVERRPSDVVLTEIGREVAERAEHLISGARDLVEFARHHAQTLAGTLRLGVIPSLAPYLLPLVLPALQQNYPELRLELRETQTRMLIDELARARLDAILLALPVEHPDFETLRLFEDPFLLAVPADDPMPLSRRVGPSDVDQQRLILLDEGHCLRDQALAFCAMGGRDKPSRLGAASLTTVMQMVANGYGVTLVPQVAVDVEVRDQRVKMLRFQDPQPARTIGLAWRRTSPRKADFLALGRIVADTFGIDADERRMPRLKAMR